MAFTVTIMTYEQRKAQLDRIQAYLSRLIEINEAANAMAKRLQKDGLEVAEVKLTVDKLLSAGGPPFITAATDLAACTGDTISDRIVNLLTSYTGGTGWLLTTPV